MMNAAQTRAPRALLGIDQRQLAEMAGLQVSSSAWQAKAMCAP
jgi:hypothetical protein